jgi:hypothetical protein
MIQTVLAQFTLAVTHVGSSFQHVDPMMPLMCIAAIVAMCTSHLRD